MLKKRVKLNRHSFATVQKKGRVFHSDTFTARVLPTTNNPCFSVVVSKKIAKSAVDRNKIKRRYYASLEGLNRLFDKRTGKNNSAVLYVKKSGVNSTVISIKNELKTLPI